MVGAICTASAPATSECRDNYLMVFLWPCNRTVGDLFNSIPILSLPEFSEMDRIQSSAPNGCSAEGVSQIMDCNLKLFQ